MKFGLRKSVMGVTGAVAALAIAPTGCGNGAQAGKVGTAEDLGPSGSPR
ncbi:hypothetical protein J7I84_02805 [Arthrobacter sp. ISL-85]|nr:hypothetical protein [Arthrobacter sp. ISL-85]MBT2565437.1 hypothetical protein [Arthrobacter sp. ISL-85]